MSRCKMTVNNRFYARRDGGLEVQQTTKAGDQFVSEKRIVLDTKDIFVLLNILGVKSPVAPVAAADSLEIGRRLDVIREGNPRVNLSWIDGDRILIGGVVDSKELRALAELMEAVR